MDKKEHNAIIAKNILANLHARNITQKDFAEAIGIAPSTLTDYLKLRTLPSHGVVQKMADYFGIEKSDLDTSYKTNVKDLNVMIDQAVEFKDFKFDPATRVELKKLISGFLKVQRRSKNS